MTAHAPVGVVLTGGASRRMGVDKAVMVVDGRPMAVRVADALWGAGCRPVRCQGGDLAALAELGLEGFADDAPGDGPLAAVAAALRHAGGADAVIAACDLVDLDAAAVTAVIDAATADADVVVARAHDRDHLLGWWSADAADRVGALVDEGTRSLREAYASLRVARVEVPPERVRNANRPDDVEA
jgi:molybdopterin-guanine dinucleotide biosynthesis protein A